MNTKMYVGNLPWTASEDDVRNLFSAHGEVREVNLPTDRTSGRPRGFAFVTMDSADAMQSAIRALGGKEWMQRKLEVSEARPRTDRPEGQFSSSKSGGSRW